VYSDLNGRIEVLVNGGSCAVGLESTVVSLFTNPPLILRPGGVTLEQLRQQVPQICLFNSAEHKIMSETSAPPTPGLKYRHYAPSKPVFLLSYPLSSGGEEEERRDVVEVIGEEVRQGKKVVLVKTLGESSYKFPEDVVDKVTIHEIKSTTEVAQQIFACLREFDPDFDTIFVESVEELGVGVAIMNRLKKAATKNILVSSSPSS
jgi:L-threonylcarbamoyladenylate synthase